MKNLTMQLLLKPNWGRSACALLLLFVTTAIALPAQTFTTLANFPQTDGANPRLMSLVQGADGNFYGTTCDLGCVGEGGANGFGTVFKVTPTGTLTTLYSFCAQTKCTDGAFPVAGLVLGTDGNFYGTTAYGGDSDSDGTVFKITSGGTLTTLHTFDSTDGAYPYAALVQATNGNFYGTTSYGGANGYGTVFEITSGGALTTLHSFDDTDGAYPEAALVQATNGNFYGTTFEGGTSGDGTVFTINSGGTLTTLHSFDGADGYLPVGALVQATNGIFYGTTLEGGTNGYGTVFKITSGGTLNTLHNFDSTDGALPEAGLVQATNGIFYGTTLYGGTNEACSVGCGTVFSITAGGTLTTLHNFDATDGDDPFGGLVQATNGTFYGTTYSGGANAGGTIFSLGAGLGPFVKTLPTSGTVGAAVTILGTNLTGATSVTFNGTAATFTVVSKSEITTRVPTGATTGKVKVVTPSRTLSSNVSFRVTP